MECIIRDDAYLSSDTVTALQKGRSMTLPLRRVATM